MFVKSCKVTSWHTIHCSPQDKIANDLSISEWKELWCSSNKCLLQRSPVSSRNVSKLRTSCIFADLVSQLVLVVRIDNLIWPSTFNIPSNRVKPRPVEALRPLRPWPDQCFIPDTNFCLQCIRIVVPNKKKINRFRGRSFGLIVIA